MKKKPRKRSSAVLPLDIWPERAAHTQGLQNALFPNPVVFSLISNPDESLKSLISLRRLLAVRGLKHVRFDHSKCEVLDLCASAVQDVLALRGKRQSRLRGGRLLFSGQLPPDGQVKLMLLSSGICKQLGLYSVKKMKSEVQQRLRVSDLRVGSPSPPIGTSSIELAATDLAEFFDECLRTEKHQLKPTLKSNLIQLITEVLDNAEEHGSGTRHWYTVGHYNRHQDPSGGGECHIVLFNFGDSIYESLRRSDTSKALQDQIRELADEHRQRGYFVVMERFGVFVPVWEEESLWTLYALQEGVSRFTNRPEGIDRGNGTVKMMEFFTELASGLPQMALLSGRTHILFDGKYRLQPISVNGETRKVIAFNASNDFRERPDEKYVRTLQEHFPGTLMSLRFHLRQEDLARIKEKVDANT